MRQHSIHHICHMPQDVTPALPRLLSHIDALHIFCIARYQYSEIIAIAVPDFFIQRLRQGDTTIPEEEVLKRARSIRKFLSEKCNDLRKC